jgi:hypothetical protein
MSAEERIVELPERPPPDIPSRLASATPETTSILPQQKSKTPSPEPSKLPLRDEDIFQRIHIIREFTTTKRRFQSLCLKIPSSMSFDLFH